MPANAWDVLKEMGERDLDIRVGPDMVRAQMSKKGGEVVMGTDTQTIHDMADPDKNLVFLLLIYDKDQFDELSLEMQ